MAPLATRASDATQDLAMMASASVLGSLTIPGRPEHVCAARAFVEKSLGEANPATDVAVFLSSETATNAVLDSKSPRPRRAATITIINGCRATRSAVAAAEPALRTPPR